MTERIVSYLLNTVIGFFTLLFLLRFFMQLCHIPFSNRIGAFVMLLTDGVVKPLRRVIPGFFGLDIASLLSAYLFQFLLAVATMALYVPYGALPLQTLVGPLLWQALIGMLRVTIHLLIGALFLQALLSWTSPFSLPGRMLAQLTHPFLKPIRRFIPLLAGIDLSPWVLIVLLQALLFLF